jgi:plastocyanin
MPALVALLLVGTSLLAACGGGDEGGGGKAKTIKAGAPLTVRAKEYSFDPGRVTITGAPKGEDVQLRITLDNAGDLAHNLKLERGGDELGGTPTFQGGEARSGTVTLEPGKYTMVCTVGDHAQLGMKGELDVRAGK